MTNNNYLNKIVKSNDNIGVIKYVGPIAGLNDDSSEWFGIEWRDYSRGKHDGSYKGVRYFETKHPTGGSFIRPNKVDFGVDIWKAIVSKYYDIEDNLDQNDKFLYNNFNFDDKMGVKCINLANCNVSSIDNISIVAEKFPYVIELDLESNLFNSWSQIFNILNSLKDIKILSLSNNLLSTAELNNDITNTYPNIKHLIINRMEYDWNDVLKIVKHFPNLIELKVCFNLIRKIEALNENLISKLTILDLECNPIEEWNNFKKLGELKNLDTLYANDTALNEIIFDDCEYLSKTEMFPNLNVLSLNENRINNWKPINELNKLKSLTDLRFKLNSLHNTARMEDIRQQIFAKIENLLVLNRTKLDFSERMGCEVDYLKKFSSDWFKANKSEDKIELKKFNYDHPNFQNLAKKYEEYIELTAKKLEPETLNSSLISLSFKNEETGQIIQKKIPSTIDIKRLKFLVSKLFKYSSIDLDSVQLVYTSSKVPNEEFELDNDFRTLSFYSLENGDTITLRFTN